MYILTYESTYIHKYLCMYVCACIQIYICMISELKVMHVYESAFHWRRTAVCS
jgi:hypothetical protein